MPGEPLHVVIDACEREGTITVHPDEEKWQPHPEADRKLIEKAAEEAGFPAEFSGHALQAFQARLGVALVSELSRRKQDRSIDVALRVELARPMERIEFTVSFADGQPGHG